jgi:hypothetical protein
MRLQTCVGRYSQFSRFGQMVVLPQANKGSELTAADHAVHALSSR